MAKDVAIRILIPKLKNPNGNFKIKVSVLTTKNSVLRELAAETQTLTLFNHASAGNPIDYLASVTDSEAAYTITSRKVSTTFNLKFNMNVQGSTIGASADQIIIMELPFYDIGF